MSAYTSLRERIERVKAEPYGRKSFMVRVDEVAELLDLVREQHEALVKNEWIDVVGTCPECAEFGPEEDGHKADCSIGDAIQRGIKAGVGEAQ